MQKQVDIDQTKKYTCNMAADAVINDQTKVMQDKNIKFQYEGCPKIREEISDYDLCTIFYNLLKNAVEGCEKVEADEKGVDVKVSNSGEQLLIRVENDTIMKDKIIDGDMFTTKKDIKNHGFGMKSVRAVVNKYNGFYSNKIEDGKFVAFIALWLIFWNFGGEKPEFFSFTQDTACSLKIHCECGNEQLSLIIVKVQMKRKYKNVEKRKKKL